MNKAQTSNMNNNQTNQGRRINSEKGVGKELFGSFLSSVRKETSSDAKNAIDRKMKTNQKFSDKICNKHLFY